MNFLIIFLALCFIFPLYLKAQVALGAQIAPQSLAGNKEQKEDKIDSSEAFINSFILELSSGSARDVFKSTEPEKEIKGYIKKGFYRQEMLIMFFMALESSFTFKSLAADIEKGKTLEYLAAKTKVNLMEMFKRTGKIKKRIEIRMTDYVSPGSIKTKIEKKAESRKQKSAQETGNNISATEITNDKKEENTKKKK